MKAPVQPAPAPLVLTGTRMAGLLTGVGFTGQSLITALAVTKAESSWDAHALNQAAADGVKWGPAVGLFQVRTLLSPTSYSGLDRRRDYADMLDPIANAQFGYELSHGGRDWSQWEAYTNGHYKRYLDEAVGLVLGRGSANAAEPTTSDPVNVGTISTGFGTLPRGYNPPRVDLVLAAGSSKGDQGLINRLVSAKLSRSITQISQVSLEFDDVDATLAGSKKLLPGSVLTVAGRRWSITRIGWKPGPAGTPHLTVKAQPEGVYLMKLLQPVARTNISHTDYVQGLATAARLRFEGQPTKTVTEGFTPQNSTDPNYASAAVTNATAPNVVATQVVKTLDPSQRLRSTTPDVESGWDMAQRLAQEVGFACFEDGGTLYFCRQSRLAQRFKVTVAMGTAVGGTVPYDVETVTFPTIDAGRSASSRVLSGSSVDDVTMTFDAVPGGKGLSLAAPLFLLGIGLASLNPAHGFIVSQIDQDLLDPEAPWTVQATSWHDPTYVNSAGEDPTRASVAPVAPGTGYVSTSGLPRQPRNTPSRAVEVARATAAQAPSDWAGMCDRFAAYCYGYSKSGYTSAASHWAAIPASFKTAGGTPPAGALVFWTGGSRGFGHVAISLGGGRVISTDIKRPGGVDEVSIDYINSHWTRLRYAGWAKPYLLASV